MDTSRLGPWSDHPSLNRQMKLEDEQHRIYSILEDIQQHTRKNSYRLNCICEHLNTDHGGCLQTEHLQVPPNVRANIHSFHSDSSTSEGMYKRESYMGLRFGKKIRSRCITVSEGRRLCQVMEFSIYPKKPYGRIRAADFRSSCMSKALKLHFVEIVSCLPFVESEIPDIIIPDCVTEDECASIRIKRDRKDQVRTLVRLVIKRSFEAKVKLLEVIRQHNSDLETKIKQSFQVFIEDETVDKKPCTVCLVKQSIDIKDVGDFYYAKDLITDDLHKRITNAESFCGNQQYLWYVFFKEMIGIPDELVMNLMIESLEEKGAMFSNIIQLLKRDVQRKRHFSCRCEFDHHQRPESRFSTGSSAVASSVHPRSSYSQTSLESSMESSGTVCDDSDDEETELKQVVKIMQTPSSISHSEYHVRYMPRSPTHATTMPSEGSVNKKRIHERSSLPDVHKESMKSSIKIKHVLKKQQFNEEFQRDLNEKKTGQENHANDDYVTLRPGKRDRKLFDKTKRHAMEI